jgi:hypothetical protein
MNRSTHSFNEHARASSIRRSNPADPSIERSGMAASVIPSE